MLILISRRRKSIETRMNKLTDWCVITYEQWVIIQYFLYKIRNEETTEIIIIIIIMINIKMGEGSVLF